MPPTILIVPGYTNSGPLHWQTLWQNSQPNYHRVEQRDWNIPDISEWTEALQDAVKKAPSPVVFVAHSLGCLTIAHWYQRYPTEASRVAGAFLVASPDVEREDTPDILRSFAPIPIETFPFPSVLITSTNDPYSDINRANQIGGAWGADVRCIGSAGHINTGSNLGHWNEGRQLLNELLTRIANNGEK